MLTYNNLEQKEVSKKTVQKKKTRENSTGNYEKVKMLNDGFSGFSFGNATKSNNWGNTAQLKGFSYTWGTVVQRSATAARRYRDLANAVCRDVPYDDDAGKTVAVSDTMVAVTPQENAQIRQNIITRTTGKTLAASNAAARGDQYANHAERKLIVQDPTPVIDIGVSRDICSSCQSYICTNHNLISHVADPDGVFEVYQDRLQRL